MRPCQRRSERIRENTDNTLDGNGGQATHPVHRLTKAVQQRTDAEGFATQLPPTQTARMRTLFLPQQRKHGSPRTSFGAGREQSEIAHGMQAAIQHLLLQNGDKFSIRISYFYQLILVPCVLCQVFNFLIRHPLHTVLGNWRASNIPSDIAQEMSLGHSAADVNVPIAIVLDFENCSKLFR